VSALKQKKKVLRLKVVKSYFPGKRMAWRNGMNAKEASLRYLSYKDRTKYEIKRHLERKGYTEDDISRAIEFLEECNFVNDEDYCVRYIEYGIEKGRGPIRLEFELKQRGIDIDTIYSKLNAIYSEDKERESAQRLIDKYIEQADKQIDSKELARIGRRLATNGYRSSLIYDLLSKYR
jgi:regulatory protein